MPLVFLCLELYIEAAPPGGRCSLIIVNCWSTLRCYERNDCKSSTWHIPIDRLMIKLIAKSDLIIEYYTIPLGTIFHETPSSNATDHGSYHPHPGNPSHCFAPGSGANQPDRYGTHISCVGTSTSTPLFSIWLSSVPRQTTYISFNSSLASSLYSVVAHSEQKWTVSRIPVGSCGVVKVLRSEEPEVIDSADFGIHELRVNALPLILLQVGQWQITLCVSFRERDDCWGGDLRS
jgi:hypothetical protein